MASVSTEPRASNALNGAAAITRSKSALELKLEALEREYARLLREIGKKKAAFAQNEQAARAAETELQLRVARLREACLAMIAETRVLFERLLASDSPLNAREKARVRKLFQRLVPDLDAEAPGAEDEPEEPYHYDEEQGPRGRRGRGDGARSAPDADGAGEAPKPREKDAQVLRAVFRRLAIALHPDKVQDPREKERRTAIMKQITAAYESGDVARLLEIEATWLLVIPEQSNEEGRARRITQLLTANKELRRQLRSLTAKLKELKQSLGRVIAKKRRRSRVEPVTEADLFVRELERELSQLRSVRDFVQSFASGQISVAEFLRGPRVQQTAEDDVMQLIMDMLDDAEPVYEEPQRRRAKRRRR